MNRFVSGIFCIIIGATPPGLLADDSATPESTAAGPIHPHFRQPGLPIGGFVAPRLLPGATPA